MITKRTNPKKHLVALSCATALATFTLVARPAFADEAKIPETSSQPTDILAPAQETVVTNVEVKAPTTNPISTNTELPTSTSTVLSEAPSSEVASSELASESPVEITSEQEISNQDNQVNKATPIKTATSEASATKTSVEKATEPVPVEETKTPTKNSEQPAPIDENEKPVTPSVTLENAPHISGGHYYSDDNGNWYYKDANGKNLVGLNYVDNVPVYFSQDGIQIKGGFAEDGRYYDKDSGALVTNRFVHIYNWNFQNQDGNRVLKFMLTIPNDSAIGSDGKSHFIDMSHYPLSSNDLDREDYYYYVDAKGNKLTGPQTLNGIHVYFDQNGRQLRSEFKFDEDGTVHYYDAKNGARAENTIVRTNTGAFKFDANGNGHLMGPGEETDTPVIPTISLDKAPRVFGGHYYSDNEGNWYYKDANGKNLIGLNFVDNIPVYFDKDGKQVKGRFAEDGRYFDKDSGALVTKRYLETEDGNWVYVNDKGDKLKGEQTINGVKVYFDDFTGIQVKGHFAPNDKYYDKDSGALVTNAFKEILTYIGRDDINNQNVYTTAWYYLDADGKPLTGPQTFGNSRFYFLPNGAQVKGRFAPDGHYYDKDSGALVTDSFVHVYNWDYRNLDGDRIFHFTITIPGNDLVDQDGQYPRESKDLDREDFYYYVDAKGDKLTGPQTLNGIHVYFDQNGKQLRGEFKFDDDGTVHYYDAKNGARAENTIVRTNTGAFKFDADGNGHLMGPDEV